MPSYLSYMRQMAVLDADDTEIESWITVRGNHIPIKKGQSKEDAVKSFIAGKKKNLVENHNSLVEAMNLEEKGYFKKDPKKRDSITQSAIEMGKEEKNLEELMEFGVKEGNAAKTTAPEKKAEPKTPTEKKENGRYERPVHISEPLKDVMAETKENREINKAAKKEYPAEFETVRKNAKANPYLYDLRYTQKSKAKAYEEYKKDTEKKDKAYNDKGLYQDALNELDDQIADKEKELENIHLSMTENAEAGYFDIASANMQDIEFVKGQLNELKKKREKLAGSSKDKK